MNNQDQFKKDVIRAVIEDWLGSVAFESAPNMQNIAPTKLQAYKSSAKRVLHAQAYEGEAERIVTMAKNKIALQANGDLEVAYWRGVCAGLKMLNESLISFSQ